MARILAINGSYRENGVTDRLVGIMADTLRSAGAEVENIPLRENPIEFCLNCRVCTQQPGTAPAKCVLADDMTALLDRIEKSDGYILASPTNFGGVTALFKRFNERLICYSYWPWAMNEPRYRKEAAKKKALLVSSCAAPGFAGRWFFNTRKELKATARIIGAAPVGTIFTGLIGKEPHPELSERVKARAGGLAVKLL